MRLRNIPGAKEAILNSEYVIQVPQEYKGRWQEVFQNGNPIHIEVGMGKGRFLMDMARIHSEVNYIGIEMYDSVLLRALQKREEYEKAQREGATSHPCTGEGALDNGHAGSHLFQNLYFMCIDARLLPEVFERGEIEKIYLNFSDPWPKARHAKRRLTSRQFLKRYEQILPEGGKIEFKTDNRSLFDFSLDEVQEAGWILDAHTYDLHQDTKLCAGNVMTEYEEKFSSMGNPIYKMIAHHEFSNIR